MANRFNQKFEEWLLADEEYQKNHNPFIEALEEGLINLPEVSQPIYE